MKLFGEDFRTKLYEIIEEIENNSLVEVVAIFRQQSNKYKDTGMLVAAILTFLVYTILILIPVDINPYLIYIVTVLMFVVSYFVIMSVTSLLSAFVKEKKKVNSVEILGRAIFQKGGVRFTEERIGVLFFVSLFEKKVLILADRGAEQAVPPEEWEKIQTQFDRIFQGDVEENFLKALSATKDIFAQFIPPIGDDINELPDNLKVDLDII
jgi:putative membrane protein